jgi:hypothetical protein
MFIKQILRLYMMKWFSEQNLSHSALLYSVSISDWKPNPNIQHLNNQTVWLA